MVNWEQKLCDDLILIKDKINDIDFLLVKDTKLKKSEKKISKKQKDLILKQIKLLKEYFNVLVERLDHSDKNIWGVYIDESYSIKYGEQK